MGVYYTLSAFWGMQVIAQLFFKWGSLEDGNWLIGFVGGNLFGFSSIWLLMILYRDLNPNIALGLATAGSFLLSQIFIAYLFKSDVNATQWTGIALIVVGVMMLSNIKLWEH